MLRAAIVLTIAMVAAACGSDDGPAAGSRGTRVITGVVIEIESESLESVSSFTLRSEGREYTLRVTGETEFAFAPGHLSEHRATAEPVEVEARGGDGVLFALRVADAH